MSDTPIMVAAAFSVVAMHISLMLVGALSLVGGFVERSPLPIAVGTVLFVVGAYGLYHLFAGH